jgi:hypothetical protein
MRLVGILQIFLSVRAEREKPGDVYGRLNRFGTLTLIYRTEKPQSAQCVYEAYKQRNEIELMFDRYKTFLKADLLYMQDRHVLEGWFLLIFWQCWGVTKSIYQVRIHGEWHRSETAQRIRKLFEKLEIGSLT